MRRAFATRLAPDGVARPACVPSAAMPHGIMKKSPQSHERHEGPAVAAILRELRGFVVKFANADPKTNRRFVTEHAPWPHWHATCPALCAVDRKSTACLPAPHAVPMRTTRPGRSDRFRAISNHRRFQCAYPAAPPSPCSAHPRWLVTSGRHARTGSSSPSASTFRSPAPPPRTRPTYCTVRCSRSRKPTPTGGPGGYEVRTLVLDNGTSTAGQYDPAQAAINARKMVADPTVVAAIGPMASGSGKAMAPLLSQGNLATVTPSSTSPDLTNPKYAAQYRPEGKAIYFRTVTTDAFQGPNMANFMADELKIKSVFVLDNSGAYGVGIADTFQAQAAKRGIQVLGRDRVDPLVTDYQPAADQDQEPRSTGTVLRLERAGRGQAGQAELRHHARHDQSGRRRDASGVDPVRCRVPGGAGLVQHHRRAAHAGRRETVGVAGEFPEAVEFVAVGLLDHRLRRGAGGARGDRDLSRSPAARWIAAPCAMPSRPSRWTRCKDRYPLTRMAT